MPADTCDVVDELELQDGEDSGMLYTGGPVLWTSCTARNVVNSITTSPAPSCCNLLSLLLPHLDLLRCAIQSLATRVCRLCFCLYQRKPARRAAQVRQRVFHAPIEINLGQHMGRLVPGRR